MTVYSVHVPLGEKDPARIAEKLRLVPEGGSPAAFFFGPLWLMSRGAWLATIGWFMIALGILGLRVGAGLSDAGLVLAFLLLQFLVGLEAHQLVRLTVSKGKYRLADIVSGATREGAEQAFLRRIAGEETSGQGFPVIERSYEQSGVGLFPGFGG